MATKPRGGGLKSLVAGPLRKEHFFCGFPRQILKYLLWMPILRVDYRVPSTVVRYILNINVAS